MRLEKHPVMSYYEAKLSRATLRAPCYLSRGRKGRSRRRRRRRRDWVKESDWAIYRSSCSVGHRDRDRGSTIVVGRAGRAGNATVDGSISSTDWLTSGLTEWCWRVSSFSVCCCCCCVALRSKWYAVCTHAGHISLTHSQLSIWQRQSSSRYLHSPPT